MQVHSNATTNKKQRERIRFSNKSCRALAAELEVSPATAHRWKHRDSPQDKSCRPNTIAYAFDPSEQALILSLRQKGLPLDDLVDLVQQPLPEATRSSVYRLLKRNGLGRLTTKEEQETGQEDKHGQFKDYGPGFVHIDCFYLPKLEGKKRYCFVAIEELVLIEPPDWRFFRSMSTRTRRLPPTFCGSAFRSFRSRSAKS